jgi:hypothetical protein
MGVESHEVFDRDEDAVPFEVIIQGWKKFLAQAFLG